MMLLAVLLAVCVLLSNIISFELGRSVERGRQDRADSLANS